MKRLTVTHPWKIYRFSINKLIQEPNAEKRAHFRLSALLVSVFLKKSSVVDVSFRPKRVQVYTTVSPHCKEYYSFWSKSEIERGKGSERRSWENEGRLENHEQNSLLGTTVVLLKLSSWIVFALLWQRRQSRGQTKRGLLEVESTQLRQRLVGKQF